LHSQINSTGKQRQQYKEIVAISLLFPEKFSQDGGLIDKFCEFADGKIKEINNLPSNLINSNLNVKAVENEVKEIRQIKDDLKRILKSQEDKSKSTQDILMEINQLSDKLTDKLLPNSEIYEALEGQQKYEEFCTECDLLLNSSRQTITLARRLQTEKIPSEDQEDVIGFVHQEYQKIAKHFGILEFKDLFKSSDGILPTATSKFDFKKCQDIIKDKNGGLLTADPTYSSPSYPVKNFLMYYPDLQNHNVISANYQLVFPTTEPPYCYGGNLQLLKKLEYDDVNQDITSKKIAEISAKSSDNVLIQKSCFILIKNCFEMRKTVIREKKNIPTSQLANVQKKEIETAYNEFIAEIDALEKEILNGNIDDANKCVAEVYVKVTKFKEQSGGFFASLPEIIQKMIVNEVNTLRAFGNIYCEFSSSQPNTQTIKKAYDYIYDSKSNHYTALPLIINDLLEAKK
jgi:hypothetical protein